jgi:hypothetical protein
MEACPIVRNWAGGLAVSPPRSTDVLPVVTKGRWSLPEIG